LRSSSLRSRERRGASAKLVAPLYRILRSLFGNFLDCRREGSIAVSFWAACGTNLLNYLRLWLPFLLQEARSRQWFNAARKIGQGHQRRAAGQHQHTSSLPTARAPTPLLPGVPGWLRILSAPPACLQKPSENLNFLSCFLFFSSMSSAFILESRNKPLIACSGPCGLSRAQ
jgi:hypothetical protein